MRYKFIQPTAIAVTGRRPGSRLSDAYPVLALIAFVVMAVGLVAVSASASAATMPPTDWSYYVTALNTNTAATLGCNQGNYDASHGDVDSTATLDFGGQNSGNTGTYLTFSDTSVSYSAIESYAKTFAYNYWICTGSDTTSYLTMSLGTNNSAYYVNSSGCLVGSGGEQRRQLHERLWPGHHLGRQ